MGFELTQVLGVGLHMRALLIGYAVLCLGLLTAQRRVFSAKWPDYSYGMYIYGYPIMVLIYAFWPTSSHMALTAVTMAAMHDLHLPHDKVNVHGGACALGHPIGASGARVLVTLLAALETYGMDRGVASLCIGGGEATAVAVERYA